MISFDIFKDGKSKAVTMSFDDGHVQDIRLVEMFNRYGIKGTFHLNSGLFGVKSTATGRQRLSEDRIRELYVGHEVSCHSTVHTTLTQLPSTEIIKDVLADRKILEGLCGYPVRGMSYPNGAYDRRVIEALRSCGIEYCRTVKSHGECFLPDDFLEWHPSYHYAEALEPSKRFAVNHRTGRLMYIWGHGFEMDDNSGHWEMMEEICETLASDSKNTWFATNIEILDHVNAQKGLKISVDGKTVYNPFADSVWFRYKGEPVCIRGGQTLHL